MGLKSLSEIRFAKYISNAISLTPQARKDGSI